MAMEVEGFKTNSLLRGQPVQIDEARCNVILYAPLSNDTRCMILMSSKLGFELLGNAEQ